MWLNQRLKFPGGGFADQRAVAKHWAAASAGYMAVGLALHAAGHKMNKQVLCTPVYTTPRTKDTPDSLLLK